MWAAYARRTMRGGVPSGYYPRDFYRYVLKPARAFLQKGMRVLDVGCGTGTLIRWLVECGFEVSGTDMQEESIETLSKSLAVSRISATLRCSPDLVLPFSDGSFDAVFCTEVLEHVVDKDRTTIMREIRRVLRTGGIIIATTPFNEELRTVICPACLTSFHPMGHVQSITEATARRWLNEAGFSSLATKVTPNIYVREGDSGFIRLGKRVTRTWLRKVLIKRFPSVICFVGRAVE